ncbi:MAG: hypothetical protein Q8N99_07330 [Nanoarchaeota archaeon]|nr:hypothetical protein [Nanoarchaeota archaeon]
MTEQYLLDIKEKDEMSTLLAEIASTTHEYDFFNRGIPYDHLRQIIPGKNGLNAVNVPSNSLCVVYSVGGNPEEMDIERYSESVVENVFCAGKLIGSHVAGMSDIIDASRTDEGLVRIVGESIARAARRLRVPILNGELANLGKRVNCDCNITGTGISFISRDSPFINEVPGVFCVEDENGENIWYAVFDPKGKLVIINSDGIGTKTEFYERFEKFEEGVLDFFAMNLDDCVKIGATPQVVSGLVEYDGNIPVYSIRDRAFFVAKKMQILSIMQGKNVKNRLKGYVSTYNISGSVVSTIDDARLKDLPKPNPGDYLVAIRGKPNPRSNGITVKREIMEKLFGKHWHMEDAGKVFGEFLAEPSTVFYPVFKELLDNGFATSVYHMSGGAYDGKLARPFARHGLYVEIGKKDEQGFVEGGLFDPDWREVLMAAYSLSLRNAHAKWPMGNEAFVTCEDPERAKAVLTGRRYESRVVGRLEEAAQGKTGVRFRAFNGEEVYFSGKD